MTAPENQNPSTNDMVNQGAKPTKASGAVSAFVMKLDQVVNDPATDDVITWKRGPDGALVEPHSLVVLDKSKFSETVMPQYFRGSKYCSFIRQLNAYDFSHVGVVNGADPPAFTHPFFRQDDRSLLSRIERRKQDKRSRTTQPDDVKTVKKVEDKIVESYAPTSARRLGDNESARYIEAVQAIRDMLASAQMFGMTHLFMERVKEFLHVERKDFSDLQDGDVLQLLDNIILGKTTDAHVVATVPASPDDPSSATSTTTSSVDDGDDIHHRRHDNIVLHHGNDLHSRVKLENDGDDDDDDGFLDFDVDELEELLADHNL
ncbi:hypothetical protein, variant 1 [Aphanomyces astaci]|uniref:HSF-type DNA-binding domain-containing protein n=1 Tax=Aphanomyces astaci TaxID=112090 RepID=W4H1C7_APHAT|nr:hypothetical protein, variant 1 [Aphanomyces astaci]ETV85820.1 hypothetical protein, variant 1 [Aphanomyces astaci]|eukprot:XP_009824293.1 hypothetical protein, variant 1 [Aphanomyces astaci]